MSLDVRLPTPEERRSRWLRKISWPLAIVSVVALVIVAAIVLPGMLGFREKLEKDIVTVRVYDPQTTKTQVMVNAAGRKIVTELPDTAKPLPNGTKPLLLSEVLNVNHWPRYQDRFVEIGNGQVQRILGDDVITVGTSPENQIFVFMPVEARPSPDNAKDPQIQPKARLNVAGFLRRTPPPAQASQLFHIANLHLENVPLPPLYVEATQVKVVQIKPMWGEE